MDKFWKLLIQKKVLSQPKQVLQKLRGKSETEITSKFRNSIPKKENVATLKNTLESKKCENISVKPSSNETANVSVKPENIIHDTPNHPEKVTSIEEKSTTTDTITLKQIENTKSKKIPTPTEYHEKHSSTKCKGQKSPVATKSAGSSVKSNIKKLDQDLSLISSLKTGVQEVKNDRWSQAPTTIDLSSILNFPMENPSLVKRKAKTKAISIGLFDGGYRSLPSVTTILSKTMPPAQKISLENWEKKMISDMGEDEFKKYKQGVLDTGIAFHACIEKKLKENVDPTTETIQYADKYWESIQCVLPSLSLVQLTESRVVHPHLHYQGSIDCLATYKRRRVVVEFKTSSKPKKTIESTYDNPLQLAAYLGALKYDLELSTKVPTASGVLLAIAYASGKPATVHYLDSKACETYWSQWRMRLAQYWKLEAETAKK